MLEDHWWSLSAQQGLFEGARVCSPTGEVACLCHFPWPPALRSFIYRDLQNLLHELPRDFSSCSDGHTLTYSNSCGCRATKIWNDSFSPAQGFGLCTRPGQFPLSGRAWGLRSQVCVGAIRRLSPSKIYSELLRHYLICGRAWSRFWWPSSNCHNFPDLNCQPVHTCWHLTGQTSILMSRASASLLSSVFIIVAAFEDRHISFGLEDRILHPVLLLTGQPPCSSSK